MTRPKRLVALVAVLVAGSALLWAGRLVAGSPGARSGSSVPSPIRVPAQPVPPGIWLDVHDPPKAYAVLQHNAWVARALAEPLGEGFVREWAGFLATRGADLRAELSGTVARHLITRLLVDPYRLVWFAGPEAGPSPVLMLPHPSRAARAAVEVLALAATRGTYVAPRCPGEPPPPAPAPEGATTPGAAAGKRSRSAEQPRFTVRRISISERSVFVAERADLLVLALSPSTALEGLCAELPPVVRSQGSDLDLSISRDGAGREAQALLSFMGVGPAPRLAIAIQDDRLVPLGIAGELAQPARLGALRSPDALLRAVPADAGVVLTLALDLPAALTAESLRAHLAGAAGPTRTREVVLFWQPRGDARLPTEVGVLWSDPGDGPALAEWMRGKNEVKQRAACGQLAFASGEALLDRMEHACAGRAPSILSMPQPIAAGLRQEMSVGLTLDAGRVLSSVLGDAWDAEQAQDKTGGNAAPPEIEAARRLLEELPIMGWRGTRSGSALVPGGCRS